MTQDEKVAILKEAGVWDVIGYPTCIDKLFDLIAAHEREKLKNVAIFSKWYEELDKAVLAEREACAKVCETDELCCKCGDECAVAIRSRCSQGSKGE